LAERATVLIQDGKFDEASPVVDQALELAEGIGPESPAVGSILMLKMGLQMHRLDWERAKASGTRAVAIFGNSLGPDSPTTVTAGLLNRPGIRGGPLV
jgi:hypothetical protein